MKNAKKILALLLCAVLLIGASVAGTLAYLTSQDTAVNTFTVGNVVIYLDEKDIDGSQTKYSHDALLNAGRDHYNKYAEAEDGSYDYKLVPGRTVPKDPTVWVKAGSEPAYIRMIVTVGGYDSLYSAFEGTDYIQDGMVVLSNLVTEWDFNTWGFTKFEKADDGKSATYEFRYLPDNGIYAASEDGTSTTAVGYDQLSPLFTGVAIPGTLDNANTAKLANVSITVVAQAIQSEGFNGDADAAWDVFPAN